VVLKPLDMPLAALQWQGELLTRLDSRKDLRVSVPLRAARGQWSSHDWTAWRYEPGEHLPGRWPDIVEAGRRLHAALQDEPEPAFLSSRSRDRPRTWAVRNSLCRQRSFPGRLISGDGGAALGAEAARGVCPGGDMSSGAVVLREGALAAVEALRS